MPRPPRNAAYALGLLSVCALARPAFAADLRFDIPSQPLATALLRWADQSGLSISTTRAGACTAVAGGVKGRMPPDEALKRLLAASGCTYRYIDTGAVEIVPSPRPPAPLAPPPPPTIATTTASASELIVVATRLATAPDRLAYPVSLVSGRTLEAQGLSDDNALATAVPSMVVTNLGTGRDKILLRGLSDGPLTGRTQSMVGIYLDDVRLTYNAPDPDLKLVDIEQVEVLRGPQGALYGSGSLGGVVHVATTRPDPKAFAATLSAGVAFTENGSPSDDLEGVVNVPAPWGGGAVRLVAYRELQGGYIDDLGLGLRDVNRTRREGLRLSAQQALNPVWTIRIGFVGQAINARDTQYAERDVGPLARRNHLREPHDNDFAQASFSLDGALPWADAHASLAAVRHSLSSTYDATDAPPVPASGGPIAYDDDNAIGSLVAEATLAARALDRLQWIVGAFVAHTHQSTTLSEPAPGAGPDLFNEGRRDDLDEAALFGEIRLPLGGRVALTLGGRAFAIRNEVSSLILMARSPGASFNGRFSTAGVAPKVVVSYQAAPGVLAYVQAAEGYRAGGINSTGLADQVFSLGAGAEPNRYYSGDELWNLEGGLRLDLFEGRLQVRSAAFDAIWRNIQSDQLLASGLPFTANIGSGSSHGLEMEGAWRDGPLEVSANLLFDKPEIDRANPAFPARAELSLAGVPSAMGGISARYSWTLGDLGALSVDGRMAYIGPSHLTFDARTSPRMGGYVTARLAATWSRDAWRVTAAVDNPANVQGDTFAYGNPFTLRAGQQVTPERPLTVSIRLSHTIS